MAIHSNTISSKYTGTDFLLLICIICSSIYIFYYKNINENMNNVYRRSNNSIDPDIGLTATLIHHNMKESECKKKCDEEDNCLFYKMTNSNLNNQYNEHDENTPITGVCTIYKAVNYKPDTSKDPKIPINDPNLYSYLYEKIFRLYILKNHPTKGLLFIPYNYLNGKLKSLINSDIINCNSNNSNQSNLAYCTSSHDVLEMQNLTNNKILDFRSIASNKLITMKSDSKIIFKNTDSWLFGITFMISKKKDNKPNIILSGSFNYDERVIGKDIKDIKDIKNIIYIDKDNRLKVFDKEILNTNKIYTVRELDNYSIYPQDNEEKDQYITIIMENNTINNTINIYYKALYKTNTIINKYTTVNEKPYKSITIDSIGGNDSNPYFGVIKNMIFSKIGINSNLQPLDCSSITNLDKCNEKIGCIRDSFSSDSFSRDSKCVKMKEGQCVKDILVDSVNYKKAILYYDGTNTFDALYQNLSPSAARTDQAKMGYNIANETFDKFGKDTCKIICKRDHPDKNIQIYSTSWMHQCYCGNKLDPAAHINTDGNCKSKCLNNSDEICGGSNTHSVYTMKDDTGKLTLEKLFEILKTETTEYIIEEK